MNLRCRNDYLLIDEDQIGVGDIVAGCDCVNGHIELHGDGEQAVSLLHDISLPSTIGGTTGSGGYNLTAVSAASGDGEHLTNDDQRRINDAVGGSNGVDGGVVRQRDTEQVIASNNGVGTYARRHRRPCG